MLVNIWIKPLLDASSSSFALIVHLSHYPTANAHCYPVLFDGPKQFNAPTHSCSSTRATRACQCAAHLTTDLLLRTQRPIKQITAEVGIQNEKSFMRAFKGWTGRTPEEFRLAKAP